MIKKALEYIVGLSEAKIHEINGEIYSDKTLQRIKHSPLAKPITMYTLSSLVDYIKSEVDFMNGEQIIHVVSPTRVEMYSRLNEDREREHMVVVSASVPEFNFDTFQDNERFLIALQSKFIKCGQLPLLLKFAGTVETGTVASYGDDGVTQKATVKTGITSKSEAVVPNPVMLMPYRTFPEVNQPASNFIFRMREGRGGVECGIFEADGGAWKNEAMQNIKEYLQTQLDGIGGYIIIS